MKPFCIFLLLCTLLPACSTYQPPKSICRPDYCHFRTPVNTWKKA